MNKSNENKGNEKEFSLPLDGVARFSGKTPHKAILESVLNSIAPVDFMQLLEIPEGVELKQKHIIVGVVKHFKAICEARGFKIARLHDFIYSYNGEYWKQISRDEIRLVLTVAAVKMGCKEYEARYVDFVDKLLKQFLSDFTFIEPEPDTSKTLINLLNGTFEFADNVGTLRDFRADDFLTYQLPFEYDNTASCPLFNNYLLRVLPDRTSREVLQEFAGYIFTNLNLEKMLMLLGNGANGKSVFFNVLFALLGKQNVLTYSLGSFNEEHNRAKLVDVLVNYSSEKGTDLNVDTLKALVSGEPLQARLKYGNAFTLHNRVRLIVNTNTLPKETEQTEAYFRRFLIVPFSVTVPEGERDTELADKIIKHELAGVFNWLLKGLDRLMTNKRFTNCEAAAIALDTFKKHSDSVALFVEEQGYKPSDKVKNELADLYKLYVAYCKDDGYKPVGKKNFSERLERNGFEKVRITGGTIAFKLQKGYDVIDEEIYRELPQQTKDEMHNYEPAPF